MKFPLDPSSEEGREETEQQTPASVAQAKRSDRTGHDASIREPWSFVEMFLLAA